MYWTSGGFSDLYHNAFTHYHDRFHSRLILSIRRLKSKYFLKLECWHNLEVLNQVGEWRRHFKKKSGVKEMIVGTKYKCTLFHWLIVSNQWILLVMHKIRCIYNVLQLSLKEAHPHLHNQLTRIVFPLIDRSHGLNLLACSLHATVMSLIATWVVTQPLPGCCFKLIKAAGGVS